MAESTTTDSQGRILMMIVLAVLVTVLAFYVLNAPDRRTTGQKVSDAVNELPNGLDKAGRQLESRTPGDKLRDAAQDATDNVKKATNQQ